jgi:hypothetical protein
MPPIDFPNLIITDSSHSNAAKKLGASDPRFHDAKFVEIQTPEGFIDRLREKAVTGNLVLVLDGDKDGSILIDGVPLDLKDLTGVKLQVKDSVYLEGESAKAFPAAASLQAKVKAAQFHDEWEVLELPIIEVVVDEGYAQVVDSTAGPKGLMHFVTLRKEGEAVVLRAKLVSANTPKNRNALKWNAPAGYRVPGNQWKVKITRNRTKKVKIPLVFYGKVIREVVVWVMWCRLKPLYSGQSVLDPVDNLGASQPRTTGALEAHGYVDWLMIITPSEIYGDKDRPALEQQEPAKVPGEEVFPDPFFGWEVATDVRAFSKKVTPTGKSVVLTAKTDPDGMYQWPNEDGKGLSEADKHENPYDDKAFFFGWPCRWEPPFHDSDGDPGEIRGLHDQARVFARVQLGSKWCRCSAVKRMRLQASALKSASGEWKQEPLTVPILEMNNSHW